MIVADRLSRKYGKITAVDAVSFRIDAGSVVGFLGPNGAGKTTTIRMIAGFLPPSEGSVMVDGLDVAANPVEIARRIGYLPESTPLYPEMRVREFLQFRARLFKLDAGRRRTAIETAMDRCWLTDVARRPINQLSKGYRQRVGLAAAILHEPPLIILDEPTVGLDPSQVQSFRALVRGLAGSHTIVLSTHILPEVEQTCDEILMIAGGTIRAAGRVDELRASKGRGSRYLVETSCTSAAKALKSIREVVAVETTSQEAGWLSLTVDAGESATDLREQIAARLAQEGGVVRELHRETPSLEQLFERVVTGVATPDASGGTT